MSNGQSDKVAIYRALSKTYDLVGDAIDRANQGLRRNPSPEAQRQLDTTILELAEKSSLIEAKMIAVRRGDSGIPMPSDEHVETIAQLTGDVEAMTTDNVTASGALALAGKVLVVATEIAGSA
jgi:hypothetical protein